MPKRYLDGGAYYIGMTSDGEQLRLKHNKTLEVQFPKLANEKMELFYGERDSTSAINWKSDGIKFDLAVPKQVAVTGDTLLAETATDDIADIVSYTGKSADSKKDQKKIKKIIQQENLENRMYRIVQLNRMGWINCDRFINEKLTLVAYRLIQNSDVAFADVYAVYRDINSMEQNNTNMGDMEMPVGRKVTFIAISCKDKKYYSFTKDITVKEGLKIDITLKETSEKDLKKLFTAIR